MDVRITPSRVRGTARAPPSKSYTHRAILAAGYADGATVRNPLFSADTAATMRAVEAYGGETERAGDDLEVSGFGGDPETPADVIDCANSGTTMRLTTATAGLIDGLAVLTGDTSLRSRPQGPLLKALDGLGVRAESTRANGQAPLVVGGGPNGGTTAIKGDVSSQYITGLLMAGAVSEDGVEIELTTELKSAPYVDITLEVLEAFGVEATVLGGDDSSTAGRPTSRLRVSTASPVTSRRCPIYWQPVRSLQRMNSLSRRPGRVHRATLRSSQFSNRWGLTSSGIATPPGSLSVALRCRESRSALRIPQICCRRSLFWALLPMGRLGSRTARTFD